jgi:D-alanyl-D-alanine carboxypeptidase (penicillin-binding protein 5/6)
MPPSISASAWSIADTDSGEVIWGRFEDEKREIASITKMMTAYVVHRYITQGIIDWDTEVEVSAYASMINGTTAKLREGD